MDSAQAETNNTDGDASAPSPPAVVDHVSTATADDSMATVPITRTTREKQESITFEPTARSGFFAPPHSFKEANDDTTGKTNDPLMGPILRRKRVVSMPIGGGRDFFLGPVAEQQATIPRERQVTPPTTRSRRVKQSSLVGSVLRRKQVSLDLLSAQDARDEFFYPGLLEGVEESEAFIAAKEDLSASKIPEDEVVTEEDEGPKLFRPLRFAPRARARADGHGAAAAEEQPLVDEETQNLLSRFSTQLDALSSLVAESDSPDASIAAKLSELKSDDSKLQNKLLHRSVTGTTEAVEDAKGEETTEDLKAEPSISIIRATRKDKIVWALVTIVMLAVTLTVTLWKTHNDDEAFLLQPVGLACVTECLGDVETRDFFNGHNHFDKNQVIELLFHVDPHPDGEETTLLAEIVGIESNVTKATHDFGHISTNERHTLSHELVVDFEDPDEAHVVNIYSTNNVPVSFTLKAKVLSPLAKYSEIVAALIMVLVYLFILLEVIHRTLVAIIGSIVALMFFFVMEGGETESIRILMLHLEWSTLGLLFGMMLIVGELSHTGIFEWCSVRILLLSKGSFHRLLVLLCVLTAVASAFLDNVTTMLLIAPVTIDMCNILDVDPRPYLISEVLLSNIGGTATLIGDPPNIIIGSAFSEFIGFVDFITDVMPCIFLLCIPLSLLLVMWIYRYYLSTTKMRVLDIAKLKRTYPIYDEPRLLIAGTVTFFVIAMFFLHPVHHKDTAWIALLGAFVTITFTNPHDVQDALRNHVEWDTLLFFAGLFVLVEVCAAMGLLEAIGSALASYIEAQAEEKQLTIAITMILWVSSIVSAFLDNIPYTATMIPVIEILAETLPDTLPLKTLAWALSFGACLGGNGTLLGASANIVTAGIATNKGYEISFLNFFYPGMMAMVITVAVANIYMLVRFAWI